MTQTGFGFQSSSAIAPRLVRPSHWSSGPPSHFPGAPAPGGVADLHVRCQNTLMDTSLADYQMANPTGSRNPHPPPAAVAARMLSIAAPAPHPCVDGNTSSPQQMRRWEQEWGTNECTNEGTNEETEWGQGSRPYQEPSANTEHRSGRTGKEMAVCFHVIGKGYICQINDFIVTVYSALFPVYQHLHLLSAQASAFTLPSVSGRQISSASMSGTGENELLAEEKLF